jgi:hypothetical protein
MSAPALDIRQEWFKREVVEATDAIVLAAKKNGSKEMVQTSRDWETMETIIRVWSILYPEDYRRFQKSQKIIRDNLRNDNASGKDKGGARIQHKMEMTPKLMNMITAIFPMQKWDTKFIAKFTSKLPMFKIPKSRL